MKSPPESTIPSHMKSKYLPKAVRRVSASGEEGNVLIEVMVSAMMITIASIGVFTAFTAAEHSTAQERHQAQAHGLAQADIARLRTMRISQLSPSLTETTTKTVEGSPYTVLSDAQFINAKTGTDTCDEKEASADYIRIRSTITWPGMGARPPVKETSLVAPPNSTARAESGALIVQVINGENQAISGIPISGSGPTPFSHDTGENGCAVFGNLLQGDYKVSATVPNMVDPDGDESGTTNVSVVAEATRPLTLQYDTPGELFAKFVTRYESSTETPKAAKSQAITLFNTEMSEARAFKSVEGLPAGQPLPEIKATSLFPFDDGYTVYAGSCEENNPDPEGKHPSAAVVQSTVPPGGTANATIELPALRLTVYRGRSTDTPKVPAPGAEVVIRDTNCTAAGLPPLRYTTNAAGVIENPSIENPEKKVKNIALPFSRDDTSSATLNGYTVCASGKASDSNTRRKEETKVNVPNIETDIPGGKSLEIFLRDGTTSGSGICP